MVTRKQVSEEYGDCTADYDVILNGAYTVHDFVEEILRLYPEEHGDIIITYKPAPVTPASRFFTNVKRESYGYHYAKGTLLAEIPKVLSEAMITKVTAHGGWYAMDYKIEI